MKQPDFIIIPTQLLGDEALQPSDRILFGYIYWIEKMALMKCVASNQTFMELTGLKERAISMALRRLEEGGFVSIIYKDASRRHRLEIKTLIAYSAVNTDAAATRPHKRAIQTAQTNGLDRTNVPQNKNINNINLRVANELVQYYGSVFKQKTTSTPERVTSLCERLKTFSVEELKKSFANAAADDWFNCRHPRSTDWHGTLDWLIASNEHIEKYLNLPPKKKVIF